MNKQTAQRLSKRIERKDPDIMVTGLRHYARQYGIGGYYGIDCEDKQTGNQFTIYNPEDWVVDKETTDE